MDLRTICRVLVIEDGEPTIGTGFLVAPGRVLTAAHVVRSKADPRKPHVGADIDLWFCGSDPSAPRTAATGKVPDGGFDPDDDWALLECKDAPAVNPLELRKLWRGHEYRWETFGFPVNAQNAGVELRGTTLTPGRRTQLRADQTQGEPAGFSGAPLIVDGAAAAMIVLARDASNTETLFALDMGVVAQRCQEVDGRMVKHDPPYLKHVAGQLEPYDLEEPAAAVGLPDDLPVASRPREIARAMLNGGVRPSLIVLSQLAAALDSSIAWSILELAAETWIDRTAVERLWNTLRAPAPAAPGQRMVLLNTSAPRIGECFTRRAGSMKWKPPGAYFSAVLDWERGQAGVALERFEQALAEALSFDPTDDPQEVARALAQNDHALRPVVMRIPPPLPTKDELAEIRSAHDGRYRFVNLLVLVGTARPEKVKGEFPDAIGIEPVLDPDQEKQAEDAYLDASGALHREYLRVEKEKRRRRQP